MPKKKMKKYKKPMAKQKAPKTPKAKVKIKKVMDEFKSGALHSGSKSGPVVTSKDQAIAIALSEARKAGKKKRKK